MLFAPPASNCIDQGGNLARWQGGMERGAAARRRTGAWCSPDRSSCTPSPPRTRTMTVESATWSACSGSGLASVARSRSYFGEFCEMFSFYIRPIGSMRCYLDMEETDGTLYLSQIPSARSRSLTKLTLSSSIFIQPTDLFHSQFVFVEIWFW